MPGDERGRLTGARLEPVLRAHPGVFAVVATAGTTNAGLIDDLAGVADVCAAHGVWMHVDGAYGGAGLAAPSVRELFDGVERADSFIVDPHKWLFAPYDCCALLYRDPALARAAHAQSANYLDQIDHTIWNPADLAIHLSRRARGLPFWFSLATHGTDRYVAAVEQTLDIARTVADAIRSSSHLRLVCEPQLSVLLFQRDGLGHRGLSRVVASAWPEKAPSSACRPPGTANRCCGWPSSTRRPGPSASSRLWTRCAELADLRGQSDGGTTSRPVISTGRIRTQKPRPLMSAQDRRPSWS